jgi:UDP-N-acetylglucosamine 2-epimerase (non-hydrolysing)
MKIAVILGTRPEIIKMSPLIRELEKRNLDYFILHTGQHYDYLMDKEFFEELELPEPRYNLNVGRNEYRKQVGLMIRSIAKVLVKEKPDIVFVQGDTNSVLAGALAANKVRIKIAHHEAGLRSHDLSMPEETNRIITDHIADYLFAPTGDAFKNLKEEGIKESKIYLTGNTIVDAVRENIELAEKKKEILKKFNLKKGSYILATAHRAENVDIEKRLKGILDGLNLVAQYFKIPVIYPIHHRTANNIKKFGLTIPAGIKIIEPLGYLEFLQLESNSKLIITDSGGLQEEACILKIPCVTVRENTERPETLNAGFNMLAGTDPERILASAREMTQSKKNWSNPFGDGHAAEKMLEATKMALKNSGNWVDFAKIKTVNLLRKIGLKKK